MGVRTTLLALTLTSNELAVQSADGMDIVGMLQFVEQNLAAAIEQLTIMQTNMPSGTNKTAFAAAVTSLS